MILLMRYFMGTKQERSEVAIFKTSLADVDFLQRDLGVELHRDGAI